MRAVLLWALTVALLGTLAVLKFVATADAEQLSNMLDSLASVTGTFGGFLLTGIAVVIGSSDRQVIKELDRIGAVRNLLRLSAYAVVILMFVALGGAAARMLSDPDLLRPISLVLIGTTFVGCVFLISAGRQYLILAKVL